MAHRQTQESPHVAEEAEGIHDEDATLSPPAPQSVDRRLSASGGPRLRRISSNGSAVSLSTSFRNPSRSYFHRSQHAYNGQMDTNQHSEEEVREQTAELSSFVLSSSVRSSSPALLPSFSAIRSLDGSVADASDDGSALLTDESIQPIEEVSEPPTPSKRSPIHGSPAPHSSGLTHLFRSSPPESNGKPGPEQKTSAKTLDTPAVQFDDPVKSRPTEPTKADQNPASEHSPLLGNTDLFPPYGTNPTSPADNDSQQRKGKLKAKVFSVFSKSRANFACFRGIKPNDKAWDKDALYEFIRVGLLRCASAVFIGLLLNILDALSYGTILFPRTDPFNDMEADGITLFYISTVVSQLVYSCGGSVFKGGVGSEMIEVVPFFHKMAHRIINIVGLEHPEAIIATTITAYAFSSVLTGLVFFGMGKLHLGSLIGFFPRHILVGCIGGVGWFLVATGIEVSAQLAQTLQYDLPTLRHLLEIDTLFMWTLPLVLSLVILALKRRFSHNSFLVPGCILAIFAAFYFFVISLDSLTVDHTRDLGWIFDRPPLGASPFHVYSYFNFRAVDWSALLSTIDIMFALTFFGILHVPINVPALGMALQEDNVDVDKELIAHGISNTVSGLCGSIQNYLVYTNSVLFIDSGGNSRFAGVLLALSTMVIAAVGMDMIGFIPRMVVGTLIFLLGFDLMMEALYDTYGRMTRLEYATIVAIMVTMGTWDFVTGILVGIVLACVNFVVQTSQKSAIRAIYSGEVARSTVRRHPDLNKYLRKVGTQIELIKLAGFLFFGTIVDVESKIRSLLTDDQFHRNPIQFLVLDFSHVNGIDFSGAEAFARINRILSTRRVRMVLSGLREGSEIKNSLRNNGLWESDNPAELVDDLNSALEFCENEFIKIYNAHEVMLLKHRPVSRRLNVPQNGHNSLSADPLLNSPRHKYLAAAATTTINSPDVAVGTGWNAYRPPLQLILETFKGVSFEKEEFWFRLAPSFERFEYAKNTVLYKPGEQSELFIILEEGLLLVEDDYKQGHHKERITPGTTCGELPFFSNARRTATVTAETDVVAWELSRDRLNALKRDDPNMVIELQRIALTLTIERMEANMSHVLVRAG